MKIKEVNVGKAFIIYLFIYLFIYLGKAFTLCFAHM